ncbi:AraC family transcriptional regulator [Novispirillum itersonii]|uniref:AraC family transcriptional regulator n=1 Tax=Novispirillum itersonii TaxID=189 RepID=UPI00036EF97A|nr:AraC family transcriptional regulator [Novispirillum itersonii]
MPPAPLPPDLSPLPFSAHPPQGAGPKTDWTRFWRVPEGRAAEFMHASFTHHAYDRHTHDRYVFGVTTGGAEQFWHRGALQIAPAGRVVVVNPGDVHDGESVVRGQSWQRRICYLDPQLFSDVAAEDGRPGAPLFLSSVLDDPDLATDLRAFHAAAELPGQSALQRDTQLRGLISRLIRRHAVTRPDGTPAGREPAAVRRVRAYLDAHPADDLSLADLGRLAGLSPLYLARSFRKAFGVPPHAYQILKRIEQASARLRAGEAPATVAQSCGFADQSHMTRQFRRAHGVTPGAFRRANAR